MKLIKLIIYIIVPLFFLNNCSSIKTGLTGGKITNSDEFLVQKKNPLVLPPDYDSLPVPNNENNLDKKKEVNNSNSEIEDLLGKLPNQDNETSSVKQDNATLEKLILEKINKN